MEDSVGKTEVLETNPLPTPQELQDDSLSPLAKPSVITLSEGDKEWLRHLPKPELHLHLEGTVSPSTLVHLSTRHASPTLPAFTLAEAEELYTYTSFLGFLYAFRQVALRLRTVEDYELITHEMVMHLHSIGVRYAEVYVSFGSIVRNKPYLPLSDESGIGVLQGMERGRKRAEADIEKLEGAKRSGATRVSWIIDIVRSFSLDEARIVLDATIALKQSRKYESIIGVGIGGDEAGGPAELFKDIFEQARKAGLRLTAHAGEACPSSSIWAALDIGAERLGHAVTAIHDTELLDVLKQKQTPLELNVTSNLRTRVLEKIGDHPIRKYWDMGLLVTLNSDDPAMFGSDLLQEYEVVMQEFGFRREDMKVLASNGVKASFLGEQEKQQLEDEINRYKL